jgi:GNAT superfamily N-acetyltransferase
LSNKKLTLKDIGKAVQIGPLFFNGIRKMKLIEFKQELLTPEMKAKIDEGFLSHALEATGREGRGDLIVFTAYDVSDPEKPIFAGAACVQIFWGQLHIKYVLVEPAYRKRGLGTQVVEQGPLIMDGTTSVRLLLLKQ